MELKESLAIRHTGEGEGEGERGREGESTLRPHHY